MTADDVDDTAVQRSPDRVRSVYDEIATHFSKTRAYPWPEVTEFLDNARTDDWQVGLDVGSGNGRHAAVLSEYVDRVVAVDVSRDLLAEAASRMDENGWAARLVQAEASRLPVASDVVDCALYVATLHHLPDREARIRSLNDVARVLTADGHALVSAWSTAHDRFDADPDAPAGFDTTIDWTLPGGETVPRFYHIYSPTEFERDLRESGLTVVDTYVSSGNCYAELRT